MLTGQAASGANEVDSAAVPVVAGSPAEFTTGLLAAPVDLSTVLADTGSAADDAQATAEAQAAVATATTEPGPDPTDETDAGLVDPELGPGYTSPQWTDSALQEATRRLDELAAAGPDSPLMKCLQENLYEDC